MILHTTVTLEVDWNKWRMSDPITLLIPQTEYEGAHLPLAPSRDGRANEPVNQLRDPAVFEENGRLFLF